MWILLLAYFTIAVGFFVLFGVAAPEGNKIGAVTIVSLLWPLVVAIAILYFAGSVFIHTIKKICEAYSNNKST
jgi:hypothetical protein